ncbi:MAG: site-2 protease family protein, partial [Chloroflexota bacterium]
MNETILTWLIFILAFGGMVLIHEFGHFIVARWSGVEVEEFGIGLPSPGALTLWVSKGYLLLKSGKRIEIPSNFRLPVNWSELIASEVKITVDEVRGRLMMRSIEAVRPEVQDSDDNRYPTLDQSGRLVESPAASRNLVK